MLFNIGSVFRLKGYDRKTISKYLIHPEGAPVYGPRTKQPGKLMPFEPYCRGGCKPECGTVKLAFPITLNVTACGVS
jgi:hypothetical protein